VIPEGTTLRIARPTDNLEQIKEQYINGLGFRLIGQFTDHEGFDGVMIGHDTHPYHLEFTHHRGTKVGDAPTKDNLLVFYLPKKEIWISACEKMESAGFVKVVSYNPYWDQLGSTYADVDGYRVVLQNA
jgi:prolyl oligopeptidase